jgi:enoyl-[acyl-carrier protein] reductase I
MIGIDFNGKNAFVTGVADDGGFAWQIAKSLKAAGAGVYLASHPRTVSIVERVLRRTASAEGRKLPYGVEGEFKPDGLFGCDVAYDHYDDIPEEMREQKGYKDLDVSIEGSMKKYTELTGGQPIDILIHSVAFSPEIQNSHLETSRKAYLLAQSISAYSLVGLSRAALPLMKDRQGSVVGLSYIAANRMVPGYGGGMASAKASLECDSRAMSYYMGEHGHRVNIVSAGPFPSRAARSVGKIDEMVQEAATKSPLRRAIKAEEVADATLYLCSDLASAVTGTVMYVDCGYHAMGV